MPTDLPDAPGPGGAPVGAVVSPVASAATAAPLPAGGGGVSGGGSGGVSGGGSGGGGSAPSAPAAPTPAPTPTPDPIDVNGEVRASTPTGDGGPIAGARVVAIGGPDSPAAVADADGHFLLTGFVPGTPLLVTAPGHAPTLMAGWAGDPAVLHLAAGGGLANRWESYLAVAGKVTLDGVPVAGAVVIGGNARGTAFGPLTTGADGRFAGVATSYEGTTAADVAVFAYQAAPYAPATTLGLTTGVAVGPGAAPADVTLRRPVGEVRLVADDVADARRTAGVMARAANGLAIAVAAWAPGQPLDAAPHFDLPGATFVARVEAESPDGLARSVWRQALDGPLGEGGTLRAALMPFPPAPGPAAIMVGEGRPIAWPATPGAASYRVALRDAGGATLWEAATPTPELALHGLPPEPPDRLEITALALPGLAPYRLADAIGAPRRLRLFDQADHERFAIRTIPLAPLRATGR